MITRYFRRDALSTYEEGDILDKAHRLGISPKGVRSEWCYHVETAKPLSSSDEEILRWLLAETFDPEGLSPESFLTDECDHVVEVGPNLLFETAFSSTARTIAANCGLFQVRRLERSRRLGLVGLAQEQAVIEERLLPLLCDRMTEKPYRQPPSSLESNQLPAPMRKYDIPRQGLVELERANRELGLSMDEQDLKFCLHLFQELLRTNPTEMELYHLGIANSDHCRHNKFKGLWEVNGEKQPRTLMEIVQEPWRRRPGNSLIAFHDDASAIWVPWTVCTLEPTEPGRPSSLVLRERSLHPTATAETHCFPTGVSPFPGAATGTGGRIRDNLAVGRGGLVVTGAIAFCTDDLHIPGFEQPWERDDPLLAPPTLATPLQIMLGAPDGAFSYGNCIGESTTLGLTRTFGMWVGKRGRDRERRGLLKPILYTLGLGQIDYRYVTKGEPDTGQLVVLIGGPGYRIGMGGGSASSMIQGENQADLDFNAVQRGAPEMEQRVWRVIRTCVEGDHNPIVFLRDLGAGGVCNAVAESVAPAGAVINLRNIPADDKSLNPSEIWVNESQERMALLINETDLPGLQSVCDRERVPLAVIGTVTGDGILVVYDSTNDTTPLNLPLAPILGELPQKTFHTKRWETKAQPLELPPDLTVQEALELVLRLPSVADHYYLTNHVDRSVGGLIAQQQGVGPHHTILCDYAVAAQSLTGYTGMAMSLGEQMVIGQVSPEAAGRLAVTESLLNMVGVKITQLADVRASANEMLALKLDAEGDWLFRALSSATELMIELEIAIDGGKDSSSMAAMTVGSNGEPLTVKAPAELVIGAYAPVPDIRKKVTPDLPPNQAIILLDLANGRHRLGGSALAQVHSQLGDDCPDLEEAYQLRRAFEVVQELVAEGLLSAVHDRSGGGLIVASLEMAFAGGAGLDLVLSSTDEKLSVLFAEEPGILLGCPPVNLRVVLDRLVGLSAVVIGYSTSGDEVVVKLNNQAVLEASVTELRSIWAETSYQLSRLRSNPACADREFATFKIRRPVPQYQLTFDPDDWPVISKDQLKPKVAVLREQGTNGDRELSGVLIQAGFEAWDINMTDLLSGKASLEDFLMIAFPGGFAHADVLDSGKGWAGEIHFDRCLAREFEQFYERDDTLSFGVCNGFQCVTLLGWLPFSNLESCYQPRLISNVSGRFESRWTTVEITESPAIMLRGMAGSVLGAWVAHGEGQLYFPRPEELERVKQEQLAPIRFVDPTGRPTKGEVDSYPDNPNGSPEGLTALCTPDGRHLGMMPHPERLPRRCQWPWWPKDWEHIETNPWLRMFRNAYAWCCGR